MPLYSSLCKSFGAQAIGFNCFVICFFGSVSAQSRCVVLTSVSFRMVNPGIFHRSQKDFLLGEKATYSAAVQRGYIHDALADIPLVFLMAKNRHLRASHL